MLQLKALVSDNNLNHRKFFEVYNFVLKRKLSQTSKIVLERRVQCNMH